ARELPVLRPRHGHGCAGPDCRRIDRHRAVSESSASPGRLRAAARVAAVAGAVGSLGLMLLAGRNTPQHLLVLFVGWVLAPFVVIAGADTLSKGWPVPVRVALYRVSLVIAPVTLFIYLARVLRPPETTGAF